MKFIKAGGQRQTLSALMKSTKDAKEDVRAVKALVMPKEADVDNMTLSTIDDDHFDPFNFKGDVSEPSYKLDAKTKEDARLDRNQVDYSFYYDPVNNQPNSFSARGFRRALIGPGAGDSVAEAIKGKSMLNVLRAYSAIEPQGKDV